LLANLQLGRSTRVLEWRCFARISIVQICVGIRAKALKKSEYFELFDLILAFRLTLLGTFKISSADFYKSKRPASSRAHRRIVFGTHNPSAFPACNDFFSRYYSRKGDYSSRSPKAQCDRFVRSSLIHSLHGCCIPLVCPGAIHITLHLILGSLLFKHNLLRLCQHYPLLSTLTLWISIRSIETDLAIIRQFATYSRHRDLTNLPDFIINAPTPTIPTMDDQVRGPLFKNQLIVSISIPFPAFNLLTHTSLITPTPTSDIPTHLSPTALHALPYVSLLIGIDAIESTKAVYALYDPTIASLRFVHGDGTFINAERVCFRNSFKDGIPNWNQRQRLHLFELMSRSVDYYRLINEDGGFRARVKKEFPTHSSVSDSMTMTVWDIGECRICKQI
jgi:hypothetical protein